MKIKKEYMGGGVNRMNKNMYEKGGLSEAQKKMDKNNNNEIDSEDLAMLRNAEEGMKMKYAYGGKNKMMYQDGGMNNISSMSLEELQKLLQSLEQQQQSSEMKGRMPPQRDIEMRARSEGRIPQGTPMEVSGQVMDTPIGPMHHGPTSSELHQQAEQDASDRELQVRIHDIRKAIKNYEPNKGTGGNYQKGGRLPRFM